MCESGEAICGGGRRHVSHAAGCIVAAPSSLDGTRIRMASGALDLDPCKEHMGKVASGNGRIFQCSCRFR